MKYEATERVIVTNDTDDPKLDLPAAGNTREDGHGVENIAPLEKYAAAFKYSYFTSQLGLRGKSMPEMKYCASQVVPKQLTSKVAQPISKPSESTSVDLTVQPASNNIAKHVEIDTAKAEQVEETKDKENYDITPKYSFINKWLKPLAKEFVGVALKEFNWSVF